MHRHEHTQTHTHTWFVSQTSEVFLQFCIFYLLQDQRYPVNSRPTGLCVIINNEHFASWKQRLGTNKDAGMTTTCLHDAKDLLRLEFNWLHLPPPGKISCRKFGRGVQLAGLQSVDLHRSNQGWDGPDNALLCISNWWLSVARVQCEGVDQPRISWYSGGSYTRWCFCLLHPQSRREGCSIWHRWWAPYHQPYSW